MKKAFWPSYQIDGSPKLGLERITDFLNLLGNPQNKMPPVFHIAGTNGKGSTSSFIKYILEADGHKVHRFTSPHLVNVNERIEISSKIITDEELNSLIEEVKAVAEKNNQCPSYFEGLAAMAFMAFSRNPAVATILEVGLGGRLDATNAIEKPLSVIITPLSMDHMRFLGDTVDKIAFEKAGIIKADAKVAISKQPPEALGVLERVAAEKSAPTFEYDRDWTVKSTADGFRFKGFGRDLNLPKPSLEGEHQIINAGTAIAALLSQDVIKVSDRAIAEGIKNTIWPGRLQNLEGTKLHDLLPKNYELWLDGAHNEDAARAINLWIKDKNSLDPKPNIVIFGILSRKDGRSYLNNIKESVDYFMPINIHGDSQCRENFALAWEAQELGFKNIKPHEYFTDALRAAAELNLRDGARVIILGSLYLAGEVLEQA